MRKEDSWHCGIRPLSGAYTAFNPSGRAERKDGVLRNNPLLVKITPEDTGLPLLDSMMYPGDCTYAVDTAQVVLHSIITALGEKCGLFNPSAHTALATLCTTISLR